MAFDDICQPSFDDCLNRNLDMNVPLLDLKIQYQTIKEELRLVIDEVCESQHFILGPRVVQMEEQLAAYCGCPHAVGVSSGTDALLAA